MTSHEGKQAFRAEDEETKAASRLSRSAPPHMACLSVVAKTVDCTQEVNAASETPTICLFRI